VVGALSGVLCAGFVLGSSAVGARPVVVLDTASSTDVISPITPDGLSSGSGASVSGDGRFVASQGAPGSGDLAADPAADSPADSAAAADSRISTVYLTDRELGTTIEVTLVPEGQRPGSSIQPVLSGDGCSIVVVTELALDVFRDDDTNSRWDVYRQRLAHCGGTPGDWELVSTQPDSAALARDDVDIDDRPAVSRSGTLIAYTHPATELLDVENLSSVSLVDLGQPLGSLFRSVRVAGMPITSPDTEYVHAGIDQPAISGDGRFVAYRSDAATLSPAGATARSPAALRLRRCSCGIAIRPTRSKRWSSCRNASMTSRPWGVRRSRRCHEMAESWRS